MQCPLGHIPSFTSLGSSETAKRFHENVAECTVALGKRNELTNQHGTSLNCKILSEKPLRSFHVSCCCHCFINPDSSPGSHVMRCTLLSSPEHLSHLGEEIRASPLLSVSVISDTLWWKVLFLTSRRQPRTCPVSSQSGHVAGCQACNVNVMTGPPSGPFWVTRCRTAAVLCAHKPAGSLRTALLLTCTTYLGNKCLIPVLVLCLHVCFSSWSATCFSYLSLFPHFCVLFPSLVLFSCVPLGAANCLRSPLSSLLLSEIPILLTQTEKKGRIC